MSGQTAQEQVNFLLACIKHSQSGGKVDFEAVATELKIASKAAAAKRYERLKKRALCTDLSASGPAGDLDGNGSPFTTPQKSRTKSAPATPGSAKRKRNGQSNNTDEEKQDSEVNVKTPRGKAKAANPTTPRVKRQQAQKAAEAIKKEAEAEDAEDIAERDEQLAYENYESDVDEIRDDVVAIKSESRNIVVDTDGF
ncbi:hypothetical protein CMQ_4790 [Grosmannia clavigera kw1407]|uniref:Myb-like DNA-binding domain-containing protein n=1 Tax=Grosmannia clavigera (strain kw1407 / UAMH 11150) TaxID=655863 RepID=F0XTG7_GROCL|nr:uncharacterized protein CMQ_4790 [Grosmannia clavigera kw1407]EFW98938.1 hypothetical protein CMQ_4790 [Grosmannia clavigera kw1407]